MQQGHSFTYNSQASTNFPRVALSLTLLLETPGTEPEHEVAHEMSEFLRTIVGRMREYAGNRRRAGRRYVRLSLTVSLETPNKVNGKRPPPSLKGIARDLSPKGLGIIVPLIRIGERYLAGQDCRLIILLELPTGTVTLHATSVRYERLDENPDDDGYLIGARITHMSDEDRDRYMAYVRDRSGA